MTTKHTKEQNAVVAPEWHQDAGRLVDGRSFDVYKTTSIPNSDLTITHLAETSGGDSVVFAHPDDPRTLEGLSIAFSILCSITPSRRHVPP